jgi:hypothetical protein
MQHYAVDIDALLARANKRGIFQTCAESPLQMCSSADMHERFKRVRGRQIDVATDAQMTVLLQSTNPSLSIDFAADGIGASVSSESTSVALHRLKLAAASYNSNDAAKDLSDDLEAAAHAICSTLCVQFSVTFFYICLVIFLSGATATWMRLAPASSIYPAPHPF